MNLVVLVAFASFIVGNASAEAPTKLLWGDTHLHTSYSFDAFLNQNQSADPDTAYRWAKGQPVVHPYNRTRVQIGTPLDFLVVSDHAELMGVIRAMSNDTDENTSLGFLNAFERRIKGYFLLDAIENETGKNIFVKILPKQPEKPGTDPVADPANQLPIGAFGETIATETTAWNEIVDAAERHNDPGKFTSIIGWEWSSVPSGANLHRVVITPDGGEKAKLFSPFGSDQSQYPEDLWAWLEQTNEKTGTRFISIPHNSNISKGYMFADTTLRGEAITAEYARRRMNWEPIIEITQYKGDSETHPSLSPSDGFADFEQYEFYIQQTWSEYKATPADYARPALKRGMAIEQEVGVNPYKFGFIGSTDAHTGLSAAEETNFWGKMAKDSTPETKRSGFIRDGGSQTASGWNMGAQGMAAVWAKENSREEIYAAFKRKETYATTGPRIAVRMFGGWEFDAADAESKDLAEIGYAKGVPMGGDLTKAGDDKAIQFLIRAVKDPKSANLDRLQLVKGWVDTEGKLHEKIFNISWSGDRQLDANGKLEAVGNTVDISIPSYENSIGAAEFSAVWTDPTFDAGQRAFYYVRVLEIPTPRHSQYDAIALQIDTPEEAPATIQERAYTSPIWYTP